MHKQKLHTLINLLFLLCFINSVESAEKDVEISLSVEAHKWTGIRLKNINKGTQLATQMTIDGEVEVYLLNSTQYSQFPHLNNSALFHSKVSKDLDFSLIIPTTDHYIMVVDNRKNAHKRSFSFHFKASLDIKPKQKINLKKQLKVKKINQQLSLFSKALQNVFIFEDIDIQLVKCGKSNAYSTDSSIFLCVEFIQTLSKKLSDKEQIQQILLFTLMHEIGHILLKKWDYPFSDNEAVIDEFATVVLVMFNHRKAAQAQAEYFSSVPADQEISASINKDTRHPLSIQRSRNIKRWLSSTDTVNKWQKLLIPFMQTGFLQILANKSAVWIDNELVQIELKSR